MLLVVVVATIFHSNDHHRGKCIQATAVVFAWHHVVVVVAVALVSWTMSTEYAHPATRSINEH